MKTVKFISVLLTVVLAMAVVIGMSSIAFAAENEAPAAAESSAEEQTAEAAADSTGDKAIAAALVVGIASALGAIAMGIAIGKSAEGISRQPEASGKINFAMMLGLVFIETLIIYALIVAILIIFVL